MGRVRSYRYELSKKHTAGVPVQLELEEGRLLLEKASARAQGENRAILDDLLHRLGSAHLEDERVSLLLAAEPLRPWLRPIARALQP